MAVSSSVEMLKIEKWEMVLRGKEFADLKHK
jgi:hypothetical protein